MTATAESQAVHFHQSENSCLLNVFGQRNWSSEWESLVEGTTNVILHRSAGFKVLANALSLFPSIGHVSWLKSVQFNVVIKGRANAWQLGNFPIKWRNLRLAHLLLKN